MTEIDNVTIKKVRFLFKPAISESTASRKIDLVRSALNRPKPQIITMQEFCNYYCINYSE